MTTDGAHILVPSRPVVLLAHAKAIEERGEDGGSASMNAYAAGRSSFAGEIALDAARRPQRHSLVFQYETTLYMCCCRCSPGFYGLNTQESGPVLSDGFALVASNVLV